MALTRSKDEINRVVALLESDAYDNAEQLAYAVLKETTEILAARTMWALQGEAAGVLWGPYFTLGQAEKAWETEVGPLTGKPGRIARIYPFPAAPPVVDDHTGPLTPCGYCQHPKWHHTNAGKRLYCGPKGSGCKCTGFEVPRD